MKKGAWSLDEVEYKTDVKSEIINTDNGTLDRNLAPPAEGVFVHGLYIEGASLSKKGGGKLEDPRPKELYSRFPIMNVSAQSPNAPDPMGGARPRGEDSSKAIANDERTTIFRLEERRKERRKWKLKINY